MLKLLDEVQVSEMIEAMIERIREKKARHPAEEAFGGNRISINSSDSFLKYRIYLIYGYLIQGYG